MKLPLAAIAVAVFVHTLWGANPVAVKFGLQVFPPLLSAFVRFVIAIVCIALWAYVKKLPLWPDRAEWPALSILSALFFVQIALMNIGFGMTSGSVGSVLTATYPMFGALFAHIMLPDDKLSFSKILGLLVAFVGAGLILARHGGGDAWSWFDVGSFVVLSHAALLGFRMIYAAQLLREMDPVRVMAWMMILSLPAFALSGMWFETVQWHNLSWPPILGLLYQGVVIAGFGFMINAHLMKRYSPSLMLSFGFVSPVSGVLLSLWLLGESLSWPIAAGTAAVGLGLYVIARK